MIYSFVCDHTIVKRQSANFALCRMDLLQLCLCESTLWRLFRLFPYKPYPLRAIIVAARHESYIRCSTYRSACRLSDTKCVRIDFNVFRLGLFFLQQCNAAKTKQFGNYRIREHHDCVIVLCCCIVIKLPRLADPVLRPR